MRKVKIALRIITTCAFLILLTGPIWHPAVFLDHSAYWDGNSVVWNDRTYVRAVAGDYMEGKTIAKIQGEGDWKIREVEQDPSHTFIVVRSFLDPYLFVDQSYAVPMSGSITGIFLDGQEVTDPDMRNTILRMTSLPSESFTHQYETVSPSQKNKTQTLHAIRVAYENCPIATEFCGYVGKINGEWIITDDEMMRVEGGYRLLYCPLPNEYTKWMNAYFE